MSKISVLQLAYGEMAAPVLTALAEDGRFEIPAIVTPPVDEALYRPVARLPQEALAEKLGAEIVRTGSLKALHEVVARIRPDLVLIATFSRIIPEETLALSSFVNIHHGQLPRQRGRANVNWAIINGEPSLSVSVHEAIGELDAGDILRQFHIPIARTDDVARVYGRINETLARALPDLLAAYRAGEITPQAQDQTRATYTSTRLPGDGRIDWRWPRARVLDFIRALARPFPGAFTYLGAEKLVVWRAREPDARRVFEGIVPGCVVAIHPGTGVEVLAGDGSLLITEAEGAGIAGDPSTVIRSSRITLGLDPADLLARIEALERKLAEKG